MTTDELRTKARRVLEWLRVEWAGEVRPPAIVELCELLNAYITTDSPDAGEAITLEWFVGICGGVMAQAAKLASGHCGEFRLTLSGHPRDGWIFTADQPEPGSSWREPVGGGRVSTRGDLRQLCQALRIPLKEIANDPEARQCDDSQNPATGAVRILDSLGSGSRPGACLGNIRVRLFPRR